MKVKFKKEEESRANKVYLLLDFAGGDADTEHPEYELLEELEFSKELELSEENINLINKYKTLKNILDINHKDYCESYKEVEKKFGKDIANLYDNGPNDPQSDFQFKCYLDDISLIGYDKEGSMYKAYIK